MLMLLMSLILSVSKGHPAGAWLSLHEIEGHASVSCSSIISGSQPLQLLVEAVVALRLGDIFSYWAARPLCGGSSTERKKKKEKLLK